jgi:uncharacterized protein YbcI
MPGFEFRYRRGRGEPTVRKLVFKNTERLARGDMLSFRDDAVARGVVGDTTLLGAAVETVDGRAGATYIRVIIDADAVYAVEDRHRRTKGDLLRLVGGPGGQSVESSASSEFVVEVDSTEDEETLITITARCHHALGAPELRRGPVGSDLNAAMSRMVTRYYRETTGRGPTRTQAFYRGEIIVVVLEDIMTKAERSLVERGRADVVLRMREAFQETMRDEMVAKVEDLTSSRVRAFMSANTVEPDVTVQTFVLDRPVRSETVAGDDE